MLTANTYSHGGVLLEEDICVIQIDFFKAHFTIHQPQISQHKELCEDIPGPGETLFVMEYVHDGLRDMLVDFRIIKDTQNLGRFAKVEDIQQIDDLYKHTIYYQEPSKKMDGVYLVQYNFKNEGNFIGIVTAKNPGDDATYTAVFPFEVGVYDWGYIPLIIIAALFLQINYWLMNGGYARVKRYLKNR